MKPLMPHAHLCTELGRKKRAHQRDLSIHCPVLTPSCLMKKNQKKTKQNKNPPHIKDVYLPTPAKLGNYLAAHPVMPV